MAQKSPPKIIVTGSLGFLGQHLIRSLARSFPATPIVALTKTSRPLHILGRLPPNVSLYTGVSLNQLSDYQHHFTPGATVIHAAALVSFLQRDTARLFDSNVTGTRRILQLSLDTGVKKFVLVSSISAVGRHPTLPTDETVYPLLNLVRADPYAHTKLLSELELESHSGQLDYLILNPSVIIGPGSSRFSTLVNLASILPLLPSLDSINSFVDARDVAAAAVLAVKSNLSGQRFIVNSHTASNTEVLRLLLHLLNKKTPLFSLSPTLIRSLDHPAQVLHKLRLYPFTKFPSSLLINKTYSSQKIRSALGWQPRYSLRQSLTDTIRWTKS